MRPNAPPNINPANNDSLAGTFSQIFNSLMQDVNGMLPAQVIAYTPPTNSGPGTVQVQPLIMLVDTAGNQIPRAQVFNIPVVQIGAGGFFVNFPIQPGNLGWILAADRDISQFLKTFTQAQPNTFRKFNFADSVFIPAVFRGTTILPEDASNCTIQSLDGSVRISLGTNKIKLTAPTIEVNGQLVFDLSVPPINITGNLFVNGTIQATGSITPDVPP